MSINHVKTYSYSNIVDAFCNVLDLYERGDRSTKIESKLSFDTKQNVYTEKLFERLMEELYLEKDKAKNVFDGATIYCELLVQYIYSIPVTYAISKNDLHIKFKNIITPPVLAIIAFELINIEKDNVFYKTLDEILTSFSSDEKTLTRLIKTKLKAIVLSRRNDYIEYSPLLDFVENIKANSRPRRDTINQKTDILIRGKDHLSQDCLVEHNDIKKQYHCCMNILRFDAETSLFGALAKCYQQITSNHKAIKDNALSVNNINVSQVISTIRSLGGGHQNAITLVQSHGISNPFMLNIAQLIPHQINPLLEVIYSDLPEVKNQKFKSLTTTLWQALGYVTHKGAERLPYIDLQSTLERYQAFDDEIAPLILIVKACGKIQDNSLSEAIDILYSNDAICLDTVSPELLHLTAIMCIGCRIKEGKNTHLSFEPLINIILGTQPLYTSSYVDDKGMLGLEFVSFIDKYYNATLLRSVYHYNTIIYRCLCTHQDYPQQAVYNALDTLESTIKKLSYYSKASNYIGLKKFINKKLTKRDTEDNLISFLLNSTLYNCIQELNGICTYLIPDGELHPAIIDLMINIDFRKAILKALDLKRFNRDTIRI